MPNVGSLSQEPESTDGQKEPEQVKESEPESAEELHKHKHSVTCIPDNFWMGVFKNLDLDDTKQLRTAYQRVNKVYKKREDQLPVPDYITKDWWLNMGYLENDLGMMCTATSDTQTVHFELSNIQLIQRYSRVTQGIRMLIYDPILPTAFNYRTAEYKKLRKHFLEECNIKYGHLAFKEYGVLANTFADLFPATIELKVSTIARELEEMPNSFFSRKITKFQTFDAVTSDKIDWILENNKKIGDLDIYCTGNIPLRKYLEQWQKGERTISIWMVRFEAKVKHGFKNNVYEKSGKKKGETVKCAVKVDRVNKHSVVNFFVIPE